jgi:quercetin dioxygenase-like cupin family protein
MSLFDLASLAADLPAPWRSTVLAQVGSARIKVLRMDAMPYAAETHDYNEGLLVVDGRMLLEVDGLAITVDAGQLYLARAGVPHAVLAGSHGTLVIVDL